MPRRADRPYVLIVDDQARNLDALEAMLAPLDCRLLRALSADEALLALLRHDVAAIVLDIRMPGMDGFELAKLIKQRRRSQHVPILFLTAHSVDERDVLQGYGIGAVDYLSKPVNAEILKSKVAVFVDLFTKTRDLAELNETLHVEVAEREKAQAELRVANEQLEARVRDRTAALTRAHQGVRENEERLRMALDVARIAAWDWDLWSNERRWSTPPEALFGFPTGSLSTAGGIQPSVHPEDRHVIADALALGLDTGIYEAEYRLLRSSGEVVWITERGRVVSDTTESPARMVGISRDITLDKMSALEKERLLEDARDARDDAERQSRLKEDFLASVSHELRTPMNVILGWLAMMAEDFPIPDPQNALAVVRRNAELQAKLIDDLLDMNRLLSGEYRLDLGPVDLGAVLHTTIEGIHPAAAGRGVEIVPRVATDVRPILGDAKRLQQVFWNLIHNAVKFTPRGGRVEIALDRSDEFVAMRVADTGQGISPEFLPHVFDRFRQERTAPGGRSGGLGLGLAITKQLIELHGGTVHAASDGIGKGATFVLHIPVHPTGLEMSHRLGDATQT